MKNPVIKLTDPSLVKLFVQRIVYDDGFERVNWCGIGRIELRPTHDAIELYRDGQFLGKWRLVEQPIAQLPPLRCQPFATFRVLCDRRRWPVLSSPVLSAITQPAIHDWHAHGLGAQMAVSIQRALKETTSRIAGCDPQEDHAGQEIQTPQAKSVADAGTTRTYLIR